ncbi:MAG: transcriptional repressor LexA [Kordiimonadaceae bacterium]|nr:transcriptional repressor LexA [Kordiimonadaceae bacterium]MBO6570321.1 transcriptional repressor LexA [Kordiimonadaceae bacterium]MBO6965581.1 transcriptional repressor LexA [Kordiimonadaceae bacterium]
MLTAKQQQLLLFIDDRLKSGGVSPSFDEMKDALGLKSKSGVHRLISALEERGFIKRMANRARALEVLKLPEGTVVADSQDIAQDNVVAGNFGASTPTADTFEIPMHGKIAAGTPIEALENVDSHVTVPASMVGRGNCYALEISGDSMIDLGIMDGDTVVIESGQTARDGEVVVALVDREEATLKTLRKSGSDIQLVPANASHETQTYAANRVQVQGRLVGLVRHYH